MASVASFFISRIDSAIDSQLTARLEKATDANEKALLQGVVGKVAIANAKITYQRYKELYRSPRWKACLAACHSAE